MNSLQSVHNVSVLRWILSSHFCRITWRQTTFPANTHRQKEKKKEKEEFHGIKLSGMLATCLHAAPPRWRTACVRDFPIRPRIQNASLNSPERRPPPRPPPPPSDRCHLCIVRVRRDCSRHALPPQPHTPLFDWPSHNAISVAAVSKGLLCSIWAMPDSPDVRPPLFLLVAPFKPPVTNGKLSAEHVSSHLIYLIVWLRPALFSFFFFFFSECTLPPSMASLYCIGKNWIAMAVSLKF